MVKFNRKLQELNRVAIPQEIIKELGIKLGADLTVELIENTITIRVRE